MSPIVKKLETTQKFINNGLVKQIVICPYYRIRCSHLLKILRQFYLNWQENIYTYISKKASCRILRIPLTHKNMCVVSVWMWMCVNPYRGVWEDIFLSSHLWGKEQDSKRGNRDGRIENWRRRLLGDFYYLFSITPQWLPFLTANRNYFCNFKVILKKF